MVNISWWMAMPLFPNAFVIYFHWLLGLNLLFILFFYLFIFSHCCISPFGHNSRFISAFFSQWQWMLQFSLPLGGEINFKWILQFWLMILGSLILLFFSFSIFVAVVVDKKRTRRVNDIERNEWMKSKERWCWWWWGWGRRNKWKFQRWCFDIPLGQ